MKTGKNLHKINKDLYKENEKYAEAVMAYAMVKYAWDNYRRWHPSQKAAAFKVLRKAAAKCQRIAESVSPEAT